LAVKDRQSRPVIAEQYNAGGEPLLLGLPVAICPSMPSMSATTSSPQQSVTPIAVGDMGRLVVRVAGGMRIVRMDERWAELFQVGFESFVRADAGLMVTPGSDSPIKYLTTAA
jgi:HK97 family phage major capsid protein